MNLPSNVPGSVTPAYSVSLIDRALVVLGLDDVGQLGQLVANRVDPDQARAAVVDHVRRVARNEARLQGLGDFGGRRHLDRDTGLLRLDLLAGELGVINAVSAVEDDGVNRRA